MSFLVFSCLNPLPDPLSLPLGPTRCPPFLICKMGAHKRLPSSFSCCLQLPLTLQEGFLQRENNGAGRSQRLRFYPKPPEFRRGSCNLRRCAGNRMGGSGTAWHRQHRARVSRPLRGGGPQTSSRKHPRPRPPPRAGLIPAVTSPAGGPAIQPLCSAPGSRGSGGAEMTDGAGRATGECCGVGVWVRGAPLPPHFPPFPPRPSPALPGGRQL